MMQPRIIVEAGPSAGKEWGLESGKNVTVGRVDQADIIIRADPMLSNLHFALEWEGGVCRLRDLKSKFGVTVNNKKVVESVQVRDGDRIKAGQSEFLLKLAVPASAPRPAPGSAAVLGAAGLAVAAGGLAQPAESKPVDLLDYLRRQPEPLFALLDGARDIRIYRSLLDCKEQYQSLYEGPRGEAIAHQGPYLVSLPKESPFLARLVADGWGKSWGMYLTSHVPFADIRRHFRRFLLVKLADGREVYFRFYDPRVMPTYLGTLDGPQTCEFFGPVSAFLMECGKPACLARFTALLRGVQRHDIRLGEAIS